MVRYKLFKKVCGIICYMGYRLYGLQEIGSYCSKKWVELHSAKFVWVYYLLLFDLINISLSLSS